MYKNIPDEVTNVIVTGKSGAGKQPRIDVLRKEYDLEQLSTGDIFRSYLGSFDEFGYEGDLVEFWNEEQEGFIDDEEISNIIGSADEEVILGLKAKYFMEKGLFVPDHITNDLFKNFFADRDYVGQVLDGYPRTVKQSRFLLDLIEEKGSKIDFILWVENTDERIISRTTKRRVCPECGEVYHLKYDPPDDGHCKKCGSKVIQRSDDTEENIRSRLQEFKDKVIPAIGYLEENEIPKTKVSGHLEDFTEENVRRSVLSAIDEMYGSL